MVAIHDALRSVVKYFNPTKSSYIDDSKISVIQYKLVFGALVGCAILTGLTSWYSRIECSVPDFNNIDKRYIEEWCYANSTFIVRDMYDTNYVGNHGSSSSDKIMYLRYYQWVTLTLIIQAAFFQIPRILWKWIEGGRARKMIEKINNLDFAEDEQRQDAIESVAKYYLDIDQRHANRHYFTFFALCQFLYFINVIAQISFTNSFLGDHFLGLLPLWVQSDPSWNIIFPKMVKCSSILYGTGGSPQKVDALCVLAMNVLFEKVYLIIWILFAFALVVAICQNLFVGMTIMSANFVTKSDITEKDTNTPSDCLLQRFLRQNLDCSVYRDLLREIEDRASTLKV